jgi:hypothetical protein
MATVEINIDSSEVCRRLGYGERSPSQSTVSLVDSQIAKAHGLLKPMYEYELKSVEGVHGQNVCLEGGIVFSSKAVSYALSDCRWASIYVATIGIGLEEQVSEMMKRGKRLEALILDAVGSEAAVQLSHELQHATKGIAGAEGCRATIKYSPGYCDWDLSQQRILFGVIDTTSLGVVLTESCMMVPIKSVSGIIGIGKLDERKPPPCLAVCDNRTSCTHKSHLRYKVSYLITEKLLLPPAHNFERLV